jgi:hypothetical protein
MLPTMLLISAFGQMHGRSDAAVSDVDALLQRLVEIDPEASPDFAAELQGIFAQIPVPVLQELKTLVERGNDLPQAARGLLEVRREGPGRHPFASLLQPARLDAIAGAQPDGVMPEVPVVSRDGRPSVVPPPAPADHLFAPIPARAADTGTDEAGGPVGGLPRGPVLAGSPGLSPTIAASLLQMGVPEPVGGRAWPAAISDRVMWMVQGEQQVAKLKLNPPNLGPIEVRLTLNQDQASIVFAAHHAAVRDALEAAMPRLRELLEQQSLQLVQADVHDPGGQRDGAADTTRHPHPSFGDRTAGDGAEDGVGSPLPLAAASHGTGLIDLFA